MASNEYIHGPMYTYSNLIVHHKFYNLDSFNNTLSKQLNAIAYCKSNL